MARQGNRNATMGTEKMSNEKTTNTAGLVWRVNYRYLVNYQLRNQAYFIPAATKEEAVKKATELLHDRFGTKGTKFTIGKTEEFVA